jgi:hypothetical protein
VVHPGIAQPFVENPRSSGLESSHLRIGRSHIVHVTSSESNSDPVPFTILLSLDDVFRILESIEDARFELRQRGSAPGLQDELATVIRMLHGKLGLEEGGSL